jgi:ATP-binding cassette subfamily B protein
MGTAMNILLRIVKYGWRHKRLTVGALAAITISTIAVMVIPYLLGVAIDEALNSGDHSRLLFFTGVIILTGPLGGGVNYGAFYLSTSVSQRVGYDLRNDFLRKLQGLSFGFYDHRQTGDLMSRGTVDVDVMRDVMSGGLIHCSNSVRIGIEQHK